MIALETTDTAHGGWQPSLPGEEKPSGLALAWDGESSQVIHKYQRDVLPQTHVQSYQRAPCQLNTKSLSQSSCEISFHRRRP